VNGTRSARNVSAAVVAGIAAWSSYSHMVHVALRFGERPEVAYVLPFSVDGMLVVSAMAMVDDKRSGRRVRPAARVAFTAGVLASIAANPRWRCSSSWRCCRGPAAPNAGRPRPEQRNNRRTSRQPATPQARFRRNNRNLRRRFRQ